MFKKLTLIVKDFNIITTNKDLLWYFLIIPLFFSFSSIYIIENDINAFTTQLLDSCLTLASLLTAFSMTSITILTTSNSPNIEKAKQYGIEKISSAGYELTYYQFIVIKSFYSILCNLLLLSFAFILQMVLVKFNVIKLALFLITFLLVHSIVALFNMIVSLYSLIYPNKA